jgi:sulfatase maturation enzyme AslB (radical SAM superfamily)
MSKHKAYQLPTEKGVIVYIPSLDKLFLTPLGTKIPEYIESNYSNQYENILVTKDYQFKTCNLIVNNFCNLSCLYCYASAGLRPPRELDLKVAKTAIKHVCQNVKDLGLPFFNLGFIGGEPTLSLDLIKGIMSYLQDINANQEIKSRVGIVSNGVFNKFVRDYIIKKFNHITISLDGPKELHDAQRITRSGNGSFEIAFNNAKEIYASGMTLGLRCTVSANTVNHLTEIIQFLHHHFPKSLIGLEPLQECGRCQYNDIMAPNDNEYSNQLIEVMKLALKEKIPIKSSILRFKCQDTNISFLWCKWSKLFSNTGRIRNRMYKSNIQ